MLSTPPSTPQVCRGRQGEAPEPGRCRGGRKPQLNSRFCHYLLCDHGGLAQLCCASASSTGKRGPRLVPDLQSHHEN